MSVDGGCLKLLSTEGVSAWTRITDTSAIESWLLRQNKKHLQQAHDDKSLHVSCAMKVIMGEHGIGPTVDDLLDGKIASIASDDDECMDQWRCHLEMTAAERQLAPVENDMDASSFAAVFREADEKNSPLRKASTTPSGTPWPNTRTSASTRVSCCLCPSSMGSLSGARRMRSTS